MRRTSSVRLGAVLLALYASCGTRPSALPDVRAEAGIAFVHAHGGHGDKYLFETMGSGVGVSDLDGDGRPELVLLQSGTLPVDEFPPGDRTAAGHATGETARLFRNQGGLRFDDITAGSGLDVAFYAMGLAVGDIDGDADRDLWVGAYGRDRVFRNDGRAHFLDVTTAAGLEDRGWNVSGAFFDADLDGDLDLYTAAYLDMPLEAHLFCGPSPDVRIYCHVDRWQGADDHLWINDGQGRFTDRSAAAGLVGTHGKGLGVVAGDWDDDGDADVFVANDGQTNLLWRNEGGARFTNVSRHSGADLNAEGRTEACMGTDLGDLDGDGDLDLYVTNFEFETNTLYRNDGAGFFTDATLSSGAPAATLPALGFGTVFLDVENDGDLDIYVANGHILDNVELLEEIRHYAQPDQLFLNTGQGRFRPAPSHWGLSLSEPRVGRGVARGDLDGDGDLDLVVNNSAGAPWVLRNDVASGHRVVLRLTGPRGRADAEGTRVVLEAAGRTLVRELVGGGSYASHSDTELVIGLGQADRIERLTLHWPGGEASEHGPLAVDRRYVFAFGGALRAEEPLPAPHAAQPEFQQP